MAKESRKIQDLKIGDPVILRLGERELHGVVVERRGPLGVDGEQIIRIQVVATESEEPDEFEVPAAALEPA